MTPLQNSEVSIIVPTLGRREQLAGCLASLFACDPPPSEVVIVDQGGAGVARQVAGERTHGPVRVIDDSAVGLGRARNVGARAAQSDLLLYTDDDCRVDRDWVGAARRRHQEHSHALLTGRVMAGGDADSVPSVRDDPDPVDHTGSVDCWALYPNNMAIGRAELLGFGGFDERFPGAEDNDFCYRWLRAGRPLRYEPEMAVVHMDWRTPEELAALRVEYGRLQGMFYAKHLRARDPRMLKFLFSDLRGLLGARLLGNAVKAPGPAALTEELRSIVQNWRRFSRPAA